MSLAASRVLVLDNLKLGIPALTESVGGAIREACMVCLDDQGHSSGVELEVTGDHRGVFTIVWQGDVTEQMRRAWRDEETATEYAACGIAILLIEKLTGYTVIEQASRGQGIDYWLGDRIEDPNQPFAHTARLEVSGIRRGTTSRIEERLKQKAQQTELSAGELPAYIVVIEFGRPQARVMVK